MNEVRIPEQRTINEKPFPLVFIPSSDEDSVKFTSLFSDKRDFILEALRSSKAILFRGFKLKNAQDFHDAIERLNLQTMDYIGGAAVRTQLTPLVFTSNESPPSEKIPFHHEMSQVR